MIYCCGSSLCGTIFLKPPPTSTALSEKAPFSLLMYLISSDNHISVYRTNIHWAVAKLSHFFHFVSFWDDSFPAPTFYWRTLWLPWRHTTPLQYTLTVHCLWVMQINLKLHINEQIIAKLCGEFKYDCLRRWLSNELATCTWKGCHGKHSYFLINARTMDGAGLEKGWWENWRGALI